MTALLAISVFGLWSSWFAVAMLAVVISFFVVAFVYMVSRILSSPQLLAWAKQELGQAIASAAIVAGLLAFLFLFNQVIVGVVNSEVQGGGPLSASGVICNDQHIDTCHVDLALYYVDLMFLNVEAMSNSILRMHSLAMMWGNTIVYSEQLIEPWGSFTIQPFASVTIIAETLGVAFDILMKSMFIIRIQYYLLWYLREAIFPVLLVFGVILRTFFFTRRLGGLLIAIAICSYIIMPMMYIAGFMLLSQNTDGNYVAFLDTSKLEAISSPTFDITTDPNYAQGMSLDAAGQSKFNLMIKRIKQFTQSGLVKSFGNSIAPDLSDANKIAKDPYNPTVLRPECLLTRPEPERDTVICDNTWLLSKNGVLGSVALLLIYASVIPFIAMLATITGIKSLSPLLGGDVEIAGLTHLI
ncbi:Uncharacterised protein [Candidatus Gugararchaeum adminiculabundum]|nr:Uncharacterised protein [Candidatus Gugararchaeum adminiculabundum]